MAYAVIAVGSVILVAIDNMDMETTISAVMTTLNNVGPGFGGVNSMANYGDLPAIVKFIFTALMLLGRLEIFGLLQFSLIRWWK